MGDSYTRVDFDLPWQTSTRGYVLRALWFPTPVPIHTLPSSLHFPYPEYHSLQPHPKLSRLLERKYFHLVARPSRPRLARQLFAHAIPYHHRDCLLQPTSIRRIGSQTVEPLDLALREDVRIPGWPELSIDVVVSGMINTCSDPRLL